MWESLFGQDNMRATRTTQETLAHSFPNEEIRAGRVKCMDQRYARATEYCARTTRPRHRSHYRLLPAAACCRPGALRAANLLRPTRRRTARLLFYCLHIYLRPYIYLLPQLTMPSLRARTAKSIYAKLRAECMTRAALQQRMSNSANTRPTRLKFTCLKYSRPRSRCDTRPLKPHTITRRHGHAYY